VLMNTPPRPPISHKPSITGSILALTSLLASGIANLMIHAKYTPTGPTTGSIDREVGHAVATGTTSVLGAIFAVPFMVGAIGLGLLSIVFVVLRLRKVRVMGAVFSVIIIALVVWSISISAGLFELIKADPAV